MSPAAGDPLAAVERAEADVRPVLAAQLRAAVESDESVAAALDRWIPDDDPTPDGDPVRRAAARQAAVLTNHARFRAIVGSDPPAPLRTTPVSPSRSLAMPPTVEGRLADLRARLGAGATTDLLGARYADALPDEERRARGQFYTPAPVADFVIRWALDGSPADGTDPPTVLDPAAGTGAFPVAALDHLRELEPAAEAPALLDRFVAVDVDDVALHVAALRLSAAAGGDTVSAFDGRACSFFDVEPDEVGPVDVVVGNPPFVRAGDLQPDRAHFRDHLRALGPEPVPDEAATEAPYAEGDRALSRRSDASVYFVTHATRFLRPGGRLGMVLPAKWLESDYGRGFRRFLADQYRVHAVVGFDTRAFDALVDTVLLLAERRGRPRPAEPAPTSVSFVRLEGPVDGSLPPLVTDALPTGDRRRVVRRPHSTFARARQCSPYLRAPEALLPLLDHPGFVPLGELATVSRGVTTGANRFFLLDRADRERWDLDDRLLRPALRSVRGFDARIFGSADVDQWILDVHGGLADPSDDPGGDPTDRAKAVLAAAGHDGLLDYVEHAESSGWHTGRTCRTRPVWFDLGPLPTPDAFVPKLLRERVFTVRNAAGAVPSNAIDCLAVRDEVDTDVLLGVLDSSLCRALMELWGRDEAGMLQLMTAETRTLPVPDVREFSPAEAAAVRDAAASLGADGPGPAPAGQAPLDEAVLGAVDIDLAPGRVRELRNRLLHRRVDGGAGAAVTGD